MSHRDSFAASSAARLPDPVRDDLAQGTLLRRVAWLRLQQLGEEPAHLVRARRGLFGSLCDQPVHGRRHQHFLARRKESEQRGHDIPRRPPTAEHSRRLIPNGTGLVFKVSNEHGKRHYLMPPTAKYSRRSRPYAGMIFLEQSNEYWERRLLMSPIMQHRRRVKPQQWVYIFSDELE